MHTIGSHYQYQLRYPHHFDIFKPSLKDLPEEKISSDLSNKEKLINSYDNSIFYTDYFISSIIKRIASLKSVGAVIYISDHGEDLLDDERNLFLHGNKEITRYVAHIPLFIWLSDLYKNYFPQKTAAVLSNKQEKISIDNIFYSLLDMADIEYEDEDLTKSIFSKKLKFYKREIISLVDYGLLDCDGIK